MVEMTLADSSARLASVSVRPAVRLLPRPVSKLRLPEEPPGPPCPLGVVAQFLALVTERPCTPAAVLRRAVGLGLLRPADPDPTLPVPARAVNRLLIAGCGLPAHLTQSTLPALHADRRAGRRVFVALSSSLLNGEPFGPPDAPPAACVAEVTSLTAPDESGTAEVCFATGTRTTWPCSRFSAAWASANCLAVLLAPAWADLPRTGIVFFGGFRSPCEDTYYWTTAGYETDRAGRVLRAD